MTWLAWRQHRVQVLLMAAVLLLGAVAVFVLHTSMSQQIQEQGLQRCLAMGVRGAGCATEASDFRDEWFDLLKAGQLVIVVLPVLLGVFSAAPLFAREIEHGTHVLAFTQSVSRVRWMAVKLVMLLVPSLVVLVVLQLLVSSWVADAGLMGPLVNGPFAFLNFESTGWIPTAHLLLSYAAGALLGAVVGRSLPAMISTLAGLVAVRGVVAVVGPSLVPSQLRTSDDPMNAPASGLDEVVQVGYLGADGRAIPEGGFDPAVCGVRGGGSGSTSDLAQCYAQHGVIGKYAEVVPASYAPMLQLIEFGVLGAVAVLLLAGTAWTLRRQH
ncbi:hypothetical protein [Saccharopolyspora spinosa]|uniref:ABC-2 family transporter n=1 Tax=Saccharopolyspora spinosa TaxID=60894 RepID=A0A2N3XR69_SACSN|nr:hypothetical protein [Saccharopolyspora spinosa]PKW13163.1 hypothetical protein A8926_0672 [Saccharopolyspora spinosa]